MNLRKFLTLASAAFGTIALCSATSFAEEFLIEKEIELGNGGRMIKGFVCPDPGDATGTMFVSGTLIFTEQGKFGCPEPARVEEPN